MTMPAPAFNPYAPVYSPPLTQVLGLPPGVGVPYSQLPYSTIAGQALPQGAGVGLGELPYASGALSQSGQLSGLLGRSGLGPALGNIRTAATGGGLEDLGYVGLRAGLGRALPGLIAAEVAPKVINAIPVGSQDQRDLLGNIAAGAGIGAAAGAPFEGVGALPGALIGGTVGGVKGLIEMFGGGDEEAKTADPRDIIAQSATSLGLDPKQYTAIYDIYTPYAKTDEAKAQIGQSLAGQMIQDRQQIQAQAQSDAAAYKQQQLNQSFALNVQAQSAKFFAPYADNIITSGIAQADSLNKMADTMPSQYASLFRNQASQAIANSQNIASAYALQTSMAPLAYAMQLSQSQNQTSVDQQYKMALAQQAQAQAQYYANGGSQGQGGFGAINQQLQPTG